MGRELGDSEKTNRPLRFSVIELVFVVAILVVIVFVAVPSLKNSVSRAPRKRTGADMRTIGSAMEAYRKSNGVYPTAETTSQLGGRVQRG